MSAVCNFTASQWIEYGLSDSILLDQTTNCWPWQRLTFDEWSSINKLLTAAQSLVRLSLAFTMVLCPLGVLGSLLCALAVYRKAFLKKQRFYKWMFAISILDFVYNFVYRLKTLFTLTLFPSIRSYQYINNEILSRLVGIIVGCSLASDLCTLCLTIERVVTLRNRDQEVNGRMYTFVEILLVVAMGCLRLCVIDVQYVVREIGTDSSGFKKYGIFNNEKIVANAWWNGFSLAISTVTPFVLLFLMIFLSVIIGILVYKRRKSRVFDKKSTHQQQEVTKQASAIIRLSFCLSFLFVCSQIGYCLNTIASSINSMAPVNFSSTYLELTYVSSVYFFQYGSLLLLRAGECSSKSLNFFFYCLFTTSFRAEIKQRWRRSTTLTGSSVMQ